jgi:hypothetical protein
VRARVAGICVTKHAIAVVGRAAAINGSKCATCRTTPESLSTDLAELLKKVPSARQCHVAIGPSIAQVRRVHTLPMGLTTNLMNRLISENVSQFFVGEADSLVVLSAGRASNGILWAWAVESRWYSDFRRGMSAAGVQVLSVVPASHVLAENGHVVAGEVRLSDGDAEAVISMQGGAADEEWREALSGLIPFDLLRCAQETLAREGSDLLASPTTSQRQLQSAFWRMRVAATIAVFVGSALLLKPLFAHLIYMRDAAERRLEMQTEYRAALPMLDLEKQVSVLRTALAHSTQAAAPIIEALAAISVALGDESVLTSFRVDSAGVDLTATTPSASELLDSLSRSHLFSDIRLVGGIARSRPASAITAIADGKGDSRPEDHVTVHLRLRAVARLAGVNVVARQLSARRVQSEGVSAYGGTR